MFDYSWQKVLVWGSFIFFLGALLLRQEAGINQDLGRHLRLGEMIVAGGEDRRCALFTNCLTYTYPDYPFVNHHWGSEVVFFVTHKLAGFEGIIILKSLVLGATFLITVLHASQKQAQSSNLKAQNQNLKLKTAVAIALIFFSVQMMADRLTTRPEIFGYLLFSLLFWILNKSYIDDKRPARLNALAFGGSLLIYITPVIILLWVNLHISFIFGLILIWLRLGASLIQKGLSLPYGKESPYQKTFATTMAVSVISTLATFLNPAGLRGALMPFSIMKDYGYTIVENMTPFFLRAFKPQPEYWIYALLAATTFILALVTGKLGKFAGLAILVFSIFPLIAVRHLAFFGLAVVPVLTPLLAEVLKGLALRRKAGPYHATVVVAGGLFLAAVVNPIPFAYAKLSPVSLAADQRHDEAIRFVKQNHFQGRMWNNYDIGSYLEWSLPQYQTFVDGRPEAFPVGFFRETYIPMQESRQKWDEVATKYDIQWVFAALTDATPWFGKWRAMIGNHEEWRIVYIDKSTVILVRLKQTD